MRKINSFWLTVALAVVLAVVCQSVIVVRIATDCAVAKLKREYTPGPYNPGFDPDKVDAKKLK